MRRSEAESKKLAKTNLTTSDDDTAERELGFIYTQTKGKQRARETNRDGCPANTKAGAGLNELDNDCETMAERRGERGGGGDGGGRMHARL